MKTHLNFIHRSYHFKSSPPFFKKIYTYQVKVIFLNKNFTNVNISVIQVFKTNNYEIKFKQSEKQTKTIYSGEY